MYIFKSNLAPYCILNKNNTHSKRASKSKIFSNQGIVTFIFMAELDKFYTKKDVAKECVAKLKSLLGFKGKKHVFLEPTAGNGAFLDYLSNYEAYDIKPEDSRIKKQDIFNFAPNIKNYITVGNPPFGKRSHLGIQVFNCVAKYSDVIAFILPVSFMKYQVQKDLDQDFKLVYNEILPENSFLDRDKTFDVNSVFQIWVKNGCKYDRFENKRMTTPPPINHSDFKIWQYNNTPKAFKFVEQDWKYAMFRQGYKDYNRIFFKRDKQTVINWMRGDINGKKSQMFFVKPLNRLADSIIKKMDFAFLASKNTSTPGFGKADFVAYYEELKREALH